MPNRSKMRDSYVERGAQRKQAQLLAGEARIRDRLNRERSIRSRAHRAKAGFILGSGHSILTIVFALLLVSALLGVLLNRESFTFAGLLEFFQTAPTVNFNFLDWTAVTLGDWGAFNFLRDFINFFLDIFNVIAFLGACLLQVLSYVLWFFKALFL